MKIAHLGASGNVGAKIVTEALSRGHQVTAIVRNPGRVVPQLGLAAVLGDVTRPEEVAPLLAGHDVIVSSTHFATVPGESLIEAVRLSRVGRVLVVGGAGSLRGADGVEIVDSPDFPEAWKPEALGGRETLKLLREVTDFDWTYLSPSALLAPGDRTGKFRVGTDDLLVGENGESKISEEDFAVAVLDELERPSHSRRRFTVGY